MSHESSETALVCPNCGHHATLNYCAQCGQENHLHKDTFWGLIVHFVGHYFHYDSKFWKTLKTLWTAPGTLTKAYVEGKRARFIPPISLYIFISAVFFIVMAIQPAGAPEPATTARHGAGPGAAARPADTSRPISIKLSAPISFRGVDERIRQLNNAPERQQEQVAENFGHQVPKLFFLMIPVTALLLLLSFARRRGTYFVHHAIFSLHVHAFFFSLFLIEVVNPFDRIDNWLTFGLLAVFTAYFVAALRRVYAIGYGRAILTTLFIGLVYAIVGLIAFIALVLYTFSTT